MRRLMLLLCIVLPLSGVGGAQPDSAPILYLSGGDLYSYRLGDAEPFRETYWGHNHSPVLSPDGRYAAYGSLPELLVELDATGEFPINYDQHPPTNIWVMEIATHDFFRIAEQPAQTGPDPIFTRRTNPVWSPDSRQLAWLQFTWPDPSERGLHLVVHDLATGTQTIGPERLPGVFGDAGFMGITNQLAWGQTLAFAAFSYGRSGDRNFAGMLMMVLDTTGIIHERPLEDLNSEASPEYLQWRWVRADDGRFYIALQYDAGWQLWDYQTGAYFAPPSAPMLVGGGGLTLTYDSARRQRIVIDDGASYALPSMYGTPALSPNTRQLAYVQKDETTDSYWLMLWEAGQAQPLVPIETSEIYFTRLAWGPATWRVSGPLTPMPDPTPWPTPTINRG